MCLLDKQKHRIAIAPVQNIGCQRNYNTPELEIAKLRCIDSVCWEPLRAAIKNQALPNCQSIHDWNRLFWFVGYLEARSLRVKQWRQEFLDTNGTVAQSSLMTRLIEPIREHLSEDQIRDIHRRAQEQVDELKTTKGYSDAVPRFASRLADRLRNRTFYLFQSDPGDEFIIGDYPFVKHIGAGISPEFGWNRSYMIMLPLSRRMCLMIRHPDCQIFPMPPAGKRKEMVRFINESTCLSNPRFVYCHPDYRDEAESCLYSPRLVHKVTS